MTQKGHSSHFSVNIHSLLSTTELLRMWKMYKYTEEIETRFKNFNFPARKKIKIGINNFLRVKQKFEFPA